MSWRTGSTKARVSLGAFSRWIGTNLILKRILLGASVLALCFAPIALQNGSATAAQASCDGVQVQPSSDLSNVADSHRNGTTFCLQDGTYEISRAVKVQGHDKFIGVYQDGSRPEVTTDTAHHVFDTGGSDEALIRSLRVSGAVGDDACEPDCGRGIGSGGTDLTISNVVATGNANAGIGGTGKRLLVKNSYVTNNGSYSFSRDGGPVSAAGIKSVNSMTVLNTVVQDNYWTGIWCDQDCGSFKVTGSNASYNGKVGIHDEISRGPALFRDNVIKGNGGLPEANRRSGLLIISSKGATVRRNVFDDNVSYAVEVVEDYRSPNVDRVEVTRNRTNGNGVVGCKMSGVKCRANR